METFRFKTYLQSNNISKYYPSKNGGYLLGDDYDPDPESNQHGVFTAVNEAVNCFGFEMVLNESRQWGLRIDK